LSGERPSPADRLTPPDGARGFSVTELLVAVILLTLVSMLFYELLVGMVRVNVHLESSNDLTTLSQRAVNVIKDELLQSRAQFEDDALGNGYLGALVLPPAMPALAGSELPLIETSGSLVPDSGSRRTGNSLLVARPELPQRLWIDHDDDAGTADVEFLGDTFYFEYFYLSQNTERQFDRFDYYLDLIRARSEPYADYFLISSLDPIPAREVAAALYADGVRYAWDSGKPIDQAIYQIQATGSLTGPIGSPTITLSQAESMLPEFRGGRVSGSMDYSVGIQTPTPMQRIGPVNLYAQSSGPFPGGFEVLVVGPPASRKALVRLVLLAEHRGELKSQTNVITGTVSSY
jgi:hypothetical protein